MSPSAVPASIFEPGADLWIVPERKNSDLVQKLDWYLNFQISKSVQHQSLTLPPTVHHILESCALKGYDWVPEENDSLLILSSHIFPNRWVLVLRGSDQLETWAQTAISKWKGLNKPSVRVFLPRNASSQQFEKQWKKLGGSEDARFISDEMSSQHG